MDELTITRLALKPSACGGRTFRLRIDGAALIPLPIGQTTDTRST